MSQVGSSGRRRLSIDRVVEAALAEVAAVGVAELTMRGVAERLGAAPMALYRHVADRDELVAGTVDRALDGVELPTDAATADVRDWLMAMAQVVRRALLRYPGTAEHLLLNGPTGPHTLAFMDTVCVVLRRTGRTAEQTAWAYDWLMTTIAAYVSKEERLAARMREPSAAGTFQDRARRFMATHPALLEVAASFTGDMEFSYRRATGAVIDAIVDGQP